MLLRFTPPVGGWFRDLPLTEGHATPSPVPGLETVHLERSQDGLRFVLPKVPGEESFLGGISFDSGDFHDLDWAYLHDGTWQDYLIRTAWVKEMVWGLFGEYQQR